ncbi:MAG: hypothetical protein GX616_03565 [Planctomycetes bacterium]|nr:hypothetical protein [Planctomycetota bacterium]
MAGISNYYRLGPVSIGTAAAPTVIGGITDIGGTAGVEVIREPVSGEIGVRTQAVTAIKPTGSFSTLDIASALGVCGSLGLSLFVPSEAVNQNLLKLYATKYDTAGTIATGAVHRLWTMRGGLLYPTRLSCSHRGNATLAYQALLASDGTNDPVAESNAALPTAADNTLWTLSTVSLAGLGATDVQSVEVDFGIQVSSEGANSELYDTQCAIDAITPRVTVTLNDVSDEVDLDGEEETTGTIVFRDRDHNGQFGTATLTLGFSGLVYVTDLVRAGQRGAASRAIVCDVEWDGTSTPFSIAEA